MSKQKKRDKLLYYVTSEQCRVENILSITAVVLEQSNFYSKHTL